MKTKTIRLLSGFITFLIFVIISCLSYFGYNDPKLALDVLVYVVFGLAVTWLVTITYGLVLTYIDDWDRRARRRRRSS